MYVVEISIERTLNGIKRNEKRKNNDNKVSNFNGSSYLSLFVDDDNNQ